jgi:hypothetical protein
VGVVVSRALAWLEEMQTTKTRSSVGRFQNRFARRDRGPARLHALVFVQAPAASRQAA